MAEQSGFPSFWVPTSKPLTTFFLGFLMRSFWLGANICNAKLVIMINGSIFSHQLLCNKITVLKLCSYLWPYISRDTFWIIFCRWILLRIGNQQLYHWDDQAIKLRSMAQKLWWLQRSFRRICRYVLYFINMSSLHFSCCHCLVQGIFWACSNGSM